ncbi:MAG: flagellar motor switch phosphatase FliY [Lachnospiraceae bacterium]|nr:flagellar motor switch phosphatase FliY [Lachnospiraceae bacterium]
MDTFKLTKEQSDELCEIANISMGNAATNLSIMVNQRVDITTPKLQIIKRSEALDDYEKTCIFVQVHYVKGLSGNNVFILKAPDVLCLTDLMMGGPGTNLEGEVTDLHLSAISEAMNQMMGRAASSMAEMLGEAVDISTPVLNSIDVDSVKNFEKMFESQLDHFVKISFKMKVGELLDSSMVQLYPIQFAEEMCKQFQLGESK